MRCFRGGIIIRNMECAELSQVCHALDNHFGGMVRVEHYCLLAECDLTSVEVIAIINFYYRYKALEKLQIFGLKGGK